MEVTPRLVLALWTGGMAAGGAIVALWRVVGPGYLWLTGSVVALFGGAAIVANGGAWAIAGTLLGLAGIAVARRPEVAAAVFGASALSFSVVGLTDSPWIPVVTGLVFLGGITSEMMLGHWYLVDPRLPRWALQRLDLLGAIGLAADVAYFVAKGALSWDPADAVLGWAFVALSLMTGLLVAGVWFSLKEPRYTGVMAATGLSYLAVLTAFGVAVLGRQLG